MKRIAVLTSGGDAPGMNAAIRAVLNQGMHHGLEVYGVYHGFQGLVEGDLRLLTVNDVHHQIKLGGTLLHSARYPEFKERKNQERAIEQLKKQKIDGLIVIGGDGSFQGALSLTKLGFPAIGIPGTIDNDIPGTEYTIGFDSAVTVALDAIDKISDTAASHERTFVIEVMGRHAGDIAIWAGVAAGADAIIIPEESFDMEQVAYTVRAGRRSGKDYSLIILAEGAMAVDEFVAEFKEHVPEQSVRGVALSHIQRGGAPTARDRVFATSMGAKAVDLLLEGQAGVYLGINEERVSIFDIVETLEKNEHKVREDLYKLNLELTDRDL
ncbi:6-phosphofructokinase [Suicoccus acidiformans]|uniref:ATP-dependent 6-phosphofructokinase n=1 Tax=Suicoccus acidiformans TaxID=2036206 RepID=A0A347WLA3_9LACT|nr:6-phosphofructokinase [Suicoccus acidiformans]AXY25860.1 6-phosphofructokinase [Suicoccus acidiformans]